MKPGTKVRLSLDALKRLRAPCEVLGKHRGPFNWEITGTSALDDMCMACSSPHADEFCCAIGKVVGPMFPSVPGAPEVDVRWEPHQLRYGYDPSDLIEVQNDKDDPVSYIDRLPAARRAHILAAHPLTLEEAVVHGQRALRTAQELWAELMFAFGDKQVLSWLTVAEQHVHHSFQMALRPTLSHRLLRAQVEVLASQVAAMQEDQVDHGRRSAPGVNSGYGR